MNNWFEKTQETFSSVFMPDKTFSRHFNVEHRFHGLNSSMIRESYIIKPKTNLGLQVFIDGIQTYNVTLHLQSDIQIKPEEIRVGFEVPDPVESQKVMRQMKKIILSHLKDYQRRISTDPKVKYVQKFCTRCVHYDTKPLNQCMKQCQFTPIDED